MSVMDMNMLTGEPCDPSVANLPLEDPRCYKAVECCIAFFAGENRSQEVTPWAGQFRYGHYTTYYWVVLLGLVALWHAWEVWEDRERPSKTSSPTSPSPPGLIDRSRALVRWVAYRHLERKPNAIISIPRAGAFALILLTIIYLMALVLTEKPYYRRFFMWGCPPIAIRTGLMAFACLPIMVALAGKANIITTLTGYGHEKLNVVHQWVAWISFLLSCVHAIPFFTASLWEPGNGGYARVVSEFYRSGGGPLTEYSGVPPLAMHFGLCIFSIPAVRKRFHKAFFWLHIGLAFSYLGLLFWHSKGAEDSWAYLWATVAIIVSSWLTRVFYQIRSTHSNTTWFMGMPGTIKLLPGPLMRLEVEAPKGFFFSPGQHCFVRLPQFSILDNHPFSIASAPVSRAESKSGEARLNFLIRAHSGFTRRLLEACNERFDDSPVSVHLDGPYGGHVQLALDRRYDSVLVIIGGSGISGCLSWLLHVASIQDSTRLKRVTVVWSVRDITHLQWIAEELAILSTCAGPVDIQVCLHVTGANHETSPQSSESEVVSNLKGDSKESQLPVEAQLYRGRPDIGMLVGDAASRGGRVLVLASGPHEMNFEAANACARMQKAVLRGIITELALNLVTFDL